MKHELADPIYNEPDTRWLSAARAAAQAIVAARYYPSLWCFLTWDWQQTEDGVDVTYFYPPAWMDRCAPKPLAVACAVGPLIFEKGLTLQQLRWQSEVLFVAEEAGIKHLNACTEEACASGCKLDAAVGEAYAILAPEKMVFLALRAEVYRLGRVDGERVKELFDQHSDVPLKEVPEPEEQDWGV